MSQIYTEENLRLLLPKCQSYRELLTRLGLTISGGNYKHLKKKIIALNLDDSNIHKKTCNNKIYWSRMSLEEILTKNSIYESKNLKQRLYKEGIFEEKCSQCGIIEWQGQKLPLQLDHINGDRF